MIIQRLASSLATGPFSCGVEALDAYLKKQASQDARRNVSSVFVGLENTSGRIIGYYTLSAATIDFSGLPPNEGKRLPRYPQVPAVRPGRLAVDLKFQGRNIGSLLLLDALKRRCASEIAWAFFLVEAKNERVCAFYKRFHFATFSDNVLAMWMKRKQAETITVDLDA